MTTPHVPNLMRDRSFRVFVFSSMAKRSGSYLAGILRTPTLSDEVPSVIPISLSHSVSRLAISAGCSACCIST